MRIILIIISICLSLQLLGETICDTICSPVVKLAIDRRIEHYRRYPELAKLYRAIEDLVPNQQKKIHRFKRFYNDLELCELVDTVISVIHSEVPYSTGVRYNKSITDSLKIGDYELLYVYLTFETTYYENKDSVYVVNSSQTWGNPRNGLNYRFINLNDMIEKYMIFHGESYLGPMGKRFEEKIRSRQFLDRIEADLRICIKENHVISIEGACFY